MDQQQKTLNWQNIHNPETLAVMLIEQFQSTGSLPSESHWVLLNELIDNVNVPEEYAQLLLCIKVVSLIEKSKADNGKSFEVALVLLDKLSDPNYRLACLTNSYFQLVFLKADILGSQGKYELVFEYLKGIYDLHALDVEFNQLREAERINHEFKVKMAISAHLGAQDNHLAYEYFSETLYKDKSLSQLNASNCNVFIILGYVCFNLKKYEESMQIFEHVAAFVKQNEHAFIARMNVKDLEQETVAMYLMAKSFAHMIVSKEEFLNFCEIFKDMSNMSDKNQILRKHVVELYQQQHQTVSLHSGQPPMTVMYRQHQKSRGEQLSSSSNKSNNPVVKNASPRYG